MKGAQLDLPSFAITRGRHVRGVWLLAEEQVEPLPVGSVRNQDQRREEDEGEDGLPQLHDVRGVEAEDDEEPDVSAHGERGGYGKHHDLEGGEGLIRGSCLKKTFTTC